VCPARGAQLADWSAACQRRGGGYRIADRISSVQQPALVMWGKQDEIIAPTDAQRFVDALPNSRLIMVDDCGWVASAARRAHSGVRRWPAARRQRLPAALVRVLHPTAPPPCVAWGAGTARTWSSHSWRRGTSSSLRASPRRSLCLRQQQRLHPCNPDPAGHWRA
jgi:hypothetical protein